MNAAFQSTKATFGPIDILISNAAYMPEGEPVATTNVDEWMKGMEVNVKGSIILAQAFVSNSSAKPTYIDVSTAGAHIGPMPAPLSAYGVSKLAALRLMDWFAFENPNVTMIHVHPGILETPMNEKGAKSGLVLPFDDSKFCCVVGSVDDSLLMIWQRNLQLDSWYGLRALRLPS